MPSKKFLDLPPEIHLVIARLIPFASLFSLVRVCKLLRRNCLVCDVFKDGGGSTSDGYYTGERNLFLCLGIPGYAKVHEDERRRERKKLRERKKEKVCGNEDCGEGKELETDKTIMKRTHLLKALDKNRALKRLFRD